MGLRELSRRLQHTSPALFQGILGNYFVTICVVSSQTLYFEMYMYYFIT